MIFYLIDAANSGKSTWLSEDTDVFVLLVYREEMECNVQMERWDMTVSAVTLLVTPPAIATWPQAHIHKPKPRSMR